MNMNKRFAVKRIGLSWAIVLLPWLLMAQDRKLVLKLNVDKAVEIALSKNPTIIVADQEIVRKDYLRKGAIAQLLPQIDASGQYSRTLKKQVMYMDMEGAGGSSEDGPTDPGTGDGSEGGGLGGFDMSEGMTVGRSNNWNAGFNAQMPVIAPALWRSVQMTKVDIEKAVEAARGSRYDLVNQVETSYYNILNAQDSHRVLQQSYDNAKLNAANYRNKFNQGTASEYDAIRAQVQVRNLEPGLLQAENAIEMTKLQLKVLLGLDMDVAVETETQLSDYEKDMYADALDVDTTLRDNTNLKAFDLNMAYAEHGLKVQQAQYYPTLALTANYTWMSMNNDFKFKDYRWNPYAVVGVAVSVPLFQGGARYFKMKEARLNLDELKYQRQDLVRNLTTQVRLCQDNIAKSIKQIDSNKEGVKEAEKAYSIMQKSFEIGSATFVELNDADLALTSARLAYYQAIYDYLAAKSQLDLVLCRKELRGVDRQ